MSKVIEVVLLKNPFIVFFFFLIYMKEVVGLVSACACKPLSEFEFEGMSCKVCCGQLTTVFASRQTLFNPQIMLCLNYLSSLFDYSCFFLLSFTNSLLNELLPAIEAVAFK